MNNSQSDLLDLVAENRLIEKSMDSLYYAANWDLTQRRLLDLVFFHSKRAVEKDDEMPYLKVYPRDIAVSGKPTGKHYKQLQEVGEKSKVFITVISRDSNFRLSATRYPVFVTRYTEGDSFIEIRFSSEMKNVLYGKEKFFQFSIIPYVISKPKVLALYDLFSSCFNSQEPDTVEVEFDLHIEHLKSYTLLTDSYLTKSGTTDFSKINDRILIPGEREINKYTNLSVERVGEPKYDTTQNGRKINYVIPYVIKRNLTIERKINTFLDDVRSGEDLRKKRKRYVDFMDGVHHEGINLTDDLLNSLQLQYEVSTDYIYYVADALKAEDNWNQDNIPKELPNPKRRAIYKVFVNDIKATLDEGVDFDTVLYEALSARKNHKQKNKPFAYTFLATIKSFLKSTDFVAHSSYAAQFLDNIHNKWSVSNFLFKVYSNSSSDDEDMNYQSWSLEERLNYFLFLLERCRDIASEKLANGPVKFMEQNYFNTVLGSGKLEADWRTSYTNKIDRAIKDVERDDQKKQQVDNFQKSEDLISSFVADFKSEYIESYLSSREKMYRTFPSNLKHEYDTIKSEYENGSLSRSSKRNVIQAILKQLISEEEYQALSL